MPKQIAQQKEKELLITLRQNSRLSLTEISKKTHIPVTTIYDKLKEACDDIITRYTVLLDFTKLGYTVRVQFFIKAHKNKREDLFQHLLMHPNVNSAYIVNNGYDFACDALFRDIATAELFARELEEKHRVAKVDSFYVLQDFKREAFLLNAVAC